MLSALAEATGFVVIPSGVSSVRRAEEVEVEMFTWPASRTREEALHD